MSLLDVHPFASHAPVFSIDGHDVGELSRDLLRLDIEEGTLGMRTMVLRLHAVGPDADGSSSALSYLAGEILDLGTELECVLGPPGLERMLFRGTVSSIEVSHAEGQAPVVSVFAEDALMGLRLTERTATYASVSDADVLDAVAGAHGLGSASGLADPTFSVIQQVEQSDLAFLRDRALRRNAELWLDSEQTLHMDDRESRPGAQILLVQGNELIEVDVRADLAHQRAAVVIQGWDDDQVARVQEEVGDDLIAAEVDDGRTGPAVVAEVFEPTPLVRSRRDALVSETAVAFAEAEMRRRARGFVTAHGTTAGSPDLLCGAHLELARVGPPFDGGGYRAVHVHHSYDVAVGHRTHFRAERPAVNR